MRKAYVVWLWMFVMIGVLAANTYAQSPEEIIALSEKGKVNDAFKKYKAFYGGKKEHSVDLLQKIIFSALKHSDAEIAQTAAYVVYDAQNKDALPYFRDAMKSKSEEVRQIAVYFIGKFGDASDAPLLVKALKDSNPDVRWAVAEVFYDSADAAQRDILLKAMKKELKGTKVTSYAVEVLAKISEKIDTVILLPFVKKALSSNQTSDEAAELLVKLKFPQDEKTRKEFLTLHLTAIKKNEKDVLSFNKEKVAENAVSFPYKDALQIIQQALNKKKDDYGEYTIRQSALRTLTKILQANTALSPKDKKQFASFFDKGLKDKDHDVQWTAVDELLKIKEGEFKELLGKKIDKQITKVEITPYGKIVVKNIAKEYGIEKTFPMIRYTLKASKEGWEEGVVSALELCEELGEEFGKESMKKFLEDLLVGKQRIEDKDVRAEIIITLGDVSGKDSLDVFQKAIKEKPSEVKVAAASVLVKLGERDEALPVLKEWVKKRVKNVRVQIRACESFYAVGEGEDKESSLSILKEIALKTGKWKDRSYALWALSRLCNADKSAIPAVLSTFKESFKDKDISVPWNALEALMEIDDEQIEQFVKDSLESDFSGIQVAGEYQKDVLEKAGEKLGLKAVRAPIYVSLDKGSVAHRYTYDTYWYIRYGVNPGSKFFAVQLIDELGGMRNMEAEDVAYFMPVIEKNLVPRDYTGKKIAAGFMKVVGILGAGYGGESLQAEAGSIRMQIRAEGAFRKRLFPVWEDAFKILIVSGSDRTYAAIENALKHKDKKLRRRAVALMAYGANSKEMIEPVLNKVLLGNDEKMGLYSVIALWNLSQEKKGENVSEDKEAETLKEESAPEMTVTDKEEPAIQNKETLPADSSEESVKEEAPSEVKTAVPPAEEIKPDENKVDTVKTPEKPVVLPLKITGITPKKIFFEKNGEVEIKEGENINVVRGDKTIATLKITKVSGNTLEAAPVETFSVESIDFDDEVVREKQ